MRIRTIHVGVGGRGRWPVEVMGRSPHYEPVALVDRDEKALRAAETVLGWSSSASFPTLGAALAAVQADAVVVVTPTHTHAGFMREAFAHGKHVLVEKGMTNSWSTAVALVAEAEEAGVRLCVAQNYRYLPDVVLVKELLSDHDHPLHPGRVGIVDLSFHRFRPQPLNFVYPDAMVWDMSCHHVDLLVNWLGPARRVLASTYNTSWSTYEHPANIGAIIELASGAICHYTLVHNATIGEWRIMLQGERGTLRSSGVGDLYPRAATPQVCFYAPPKEQLKAGEAVECEPPPAVRTEDAVAEDFYRYVAEGAEPGISGRCNLESLAICEMLIRSSRLQRAVDREEVG